MMDIEQDRRASGSSECAVVDLDDLEWEECALGGFVRRLSRTESEFDRSYHQELAEMDAKLLQASRLETKRTRGKRQREEGREGADIYMQLAQLATKLSERTDAPNAPALQPSRLRHVTILLGPPGAGKDLQLSRLSTELGVPALMVAGLLRAAAASDSELGQQLRTDGRASDAISLAVLNERICHADCADGFILDGFPNSMAQARQLDTLLTAASARVQRVIVLQVPKRILIERICGRWVHMSSGRTYHTKYAPPRSMMRVGGSSKVMAAFMLDDQTGEPLTQREEDTEEALEVRMGLFEEQTAAVLAQFEEVVDEIDASRPQADVWSEILTILQGDGASTEASLSPRSSK